MARKPIVQTSAQHKDNPELLWVDAIYMARDEDQGVNNPLVRALPRLINEDSVLAAFRSAPVFDVADRDLSVSARVHRVGSLSLYVETLTCHPGLIESIFRIVTQGYAWRNPFMNVREHVRVHYAMSMNGDGIVPIVPLRPSHAAGFALFGVSGVGKTTSLNRTLSFFPPVIRHKELRDSCLQVVWLKVDCPPDGSLNQLFHWILLEYDRLLGTRYSKEVGRNARLDALINKVAAVAKYHHTGIIVIDEIQFAVNGAIRRGDEVMDFFVSFSNVVGVPLVIAGTPKALSLFEKSLRLSRRACDHGAIIYKNMAFDAEWSHFLTELFEFQWVRRPKALDDKFSKVLYDATQGIHSLLIRLFQLAQITAIRDGSEELSVSLIRQLAKERFGPVQPILTALRSRKQKRIEQYDDLLAETLSGLDEEVIKNTRAAQVTRAAEQRQTNSAQLAAVSSLVAMDIPQSFALKAVLAALAQEPELTGGRLLKAAYARAETMSTPAPPEVRANGLDVADITRNAASAEEALAALHRAGVLA